MKTSRVSLITFVVLALFWLAVKLENSIDAGFAKDIVSVSMALVGIWYLWFMAKIYLEQRKQKR